MAKAAVTNKGATRPSQSSPPQQEDREIKESTPLLTPSLDNKQEQGPVSALADAVQSLKMEDVKKRADAAWINVTKKLVETKQRMKTSPWILSIVIGVTSLGVMWAGIFDIVGYLFRFRPMVSLIKVYQVLFALVCLIAEVSRYDTFFYSKRFVHRWLPFMELTFGRGCVQVLTAGLALGQDFFSAESIVGLLLGAAGCLNILWGIQCFFKLRRVLKDFKSEEAEDESVSSASQPERKTRSLALMQRKFRALDLNGDGRLSREELLAGCRALNFALEEEDVSTVFVILDPDSKGYIDISDFEAWWYTHKGPLSLFV